MNKYPLIGGSICAIILIILSSQTSVVAYQTHTLNNPHNEESITIAVIESKADGTSKKSTVTLSHDLYLQLNEELNGVKDPDRRFAVYQKYGLIPSNMTMEKLRLGMEGRALGKHTLLQKFGKNKIVLGTFCKVHVRAEVMLYPFFRKIIVGAVLPNIPLPSINFLNFYWLANPLDVNDVSYNYYFFTQFIGFVGLTMIISYSPFYQDGFESWGYCILCLGEGY
jgi:hypothetical protein